MKREWVKLVSPRAGKPSNRSAAVDLVSCLAIEPTEAAQLADAATIMCKLAEAPTDTPRSRISFRAST
jgi:hypothetical protein